jgi:hypothetical protein
LSDDNRQRRQDIEEEGKIEAIQGDANRARLRIGLDCTPAIAAKLLSGEHIDSDVWQPPAAPMATDQPGAQPMAASKSLTSSSHASSREEPQ